MTKRISALCLALLSGSIVATTGSCPAPMAAAPKMEASKSSSAVKKITTTQELDELRKSGKHMAVKIGTDSCGPCQSMKPVFAKVAEQHPDVVFVEFDVSTNNAAQGDVLRLYNADSWPSLVLFDKQGKHVPPTEKGGITNPAEIDGIIRVLKGEMKWMDAPAEGAMPAQMPAAQKAAPVNKQAPQPMQKTMAAPMQAPAAQAMPAVVQQAPVMQAQPQAPQSKTYRTVSRIRSLKN